MIAWNAKIVPPAKLFVITVTPWANTLPRTTIRWKKNLFQASTKKFLVIHKTQDSRFFLSPFFFFFWCILEKIPRSISTSISIGFISSRSFCRFLNKRFLKCLLVLSSLKRNFQIWPQIPSFQELQPSLIMTLGHSTEFQGGIFPFLME